MLSGWDVWKLRSMYCIFYLRYPQFRTGLSGHTPWHTEQHLCFKFLMIFLPTLLGNTLNPFPPLKQTASQLPPVPLMPIDWVILVFGPWHHGRFLRCSVALWKKKSPSLHLKHEATSPRWPFICQNSDLFFHLFTFEKTRALINIWLDVKTQIEIVTKV